MKRLVSMAASAMEVRIMLMTNNWRVCFLFLASVVELPVLAGNLTAKIAEKYFVKSTDVWYGGLRTVFNFDGYEAWVVEPPEGVKPAIGRPWTWTMQWRDAFVPRTGVPQLLRKGYHHVTIDTYGRRMNKDGLCISAAFQRYLVGVLGFSPRCNLIGMSWGGFFSTRYAANYPQNVAKIYLDCPYLNLGGCCKPLDIGPWAKNAPENWIDDPRMPINLTKQIAEAGIPILLAYGGADDVLDPKLNSEIFISRFKAAGGCLKVVYRKSFGHHPHGFEESDTRIVEFFK